MSDSARNPVRIEVATSEIDGGACRAWADPTLVVAAVARSSPEDTFSRFVLPRLEGLGADLEEGAGIGDELPVALRNLLLRIRGVHTRLFHDNHSLMRDARWVELTCVAAEEDRIYLVRTAPSWVCILRAGQPLLADPGTNDARVTALGGAESLRLEVSSLSIEPGDVVVVLCAASESKPDLLSVQRLFGQTHDLKRACDGLVNLIGIQSPGASAVALRFVPVESTRERGAGTNPVDGLVDWPVVAEPVNAADPSEPATATSPAPGPAPTSASDDWSWIGRSSLLEDDIEDVEAPPSAPPAVDPNPTSIAPSAAGTAPEWQFPWEMEVSSRVRADRTPAFEQAPILVGADSPVDAQLGERPASKSPASRKRFVVLGGVALVLVLLAAIPLRNGSLFGPGTADLWIEPNPAGQGVYLDGQHVAERTPCRVPDIKGGMHTLEIDYGASGRWQGRVQVTGGKPFKWSESIRGSIEVSARDASAAGAAWVQGGQKIAIPATLESLPLGWTRLFYEDDRIPLWDRQVLVRADGPVSVSIPNQYAGEDAFIAVEGMRLEEGKGLIVSRGDSVFIDDGFTGLTPLEMATTPGLHSVRVTAVGETRTQMCELRTGGSRQLVVAFDGQVLPSFRHQPPGNVVIQGPVALSVRIENPDGGTLSRPALHMPDLEAAWREVPLQAIEGGTQYVALLQPGVLPRGVRVRYYFTVMGPRGDAVYSDLYSLVAEGVAPQVRVNSEGDGAEPGADPEEELTPTTP